MEFFLEQMSEPGRLAATQTHAHARACVHVRTPPPAIEPGH